jgi:hypothetical protein
LGAIIAVVMGIQKHWDSIVQVFKEDGILDGIKKIGVVIFDSMLAPIQQFIGFLAKIPGVGDLVAPAMKYIEGIRANLDLTNDSNEPKKNPIIPTEQNIYNKMSIENTSKGSIDLNLNDPGGMVKDVQSTGNVNLPVLGNTQGQR